MSGDIPGYGDLGQMITAWDTDKCGQLCLDKNGCNSYEYSPVEKKCNLNKDSSPTAAPVRDYAFCVKNKPGTSSKSSWFADFLLCKRYCLLCVIYVSERGVQ